MITKQELLCFVGVHKIKWEGDSGLFDLFESNQVRVYEEFGHCQYCGYPSFRKVRVRKPSEQE